MTHIKEEREKGEGGGGHKKYRCETLGVKIVREKDVMNKSFPFFTY